MENLFIKGRYKKVGEFLQIFNTGTTISLHVLARSVTFDLRPIGKHCFVYVIKDFDYNQKEKYFIDEDIDLTISLDDNKPHYIDLVKANEALDNSLLIKDIKTDGKVLNYEEKPSKFIKVYGDSTVAGYGILAHSGVADVDTSDGVEDFCFRALYSLKCDHDIFAASGWGLVFSQFSDPQTDGVEKYRDCLCIKNDEKWVSKDPDLLIISLGTNDFSYMVINPDKKEELEAKFIASYRKFIEKERKNNSSLPVLMVYGTLKEEWVYPLIEKTYNVLSKEFDNLYLVKIPGDNTGIDNHCHVSHHKEMAEVLKEKIISILG